MDQRAYLESVLSSLTDPLFVVSPDATLKIVNQAARDLSGYRDDELIGRPLKALFLKEEEDHLKRGLQKIITASVPSDIGLTLLTKQGQKIPVKFSGAVMRPYGKIIGLVGVARDMRQIMTTIAATASASSACTA